jgi:hypothetical protein
LVKLHQSSVKLQQSLVNLHQSLVKLHQSAVNVHQPSVKLQQPSVNLHQPSVKLHQSLVNVHQPSVKLQQASVNLHQSAVRPLAKRLQSELRQFLGAGAVVLLEELGHATRHPPALHQQLWDLLGCLLHAGRERRLLLGKPLDVRRDLRQTEARPVQMSRVHGIRI